MKFSIATVAAAAVLSMAVMAPSTTVYAEVAVANAAEGWFSSATSAPSTGGVSSLSPTPTVSPGPRKCSLFDAINRKAPKVALYAAQCSIVTEELPIIALRVLADDNARADFCKCTKLADYVAKNQQALPDCVLPLGQPAISVRDFLTGIFSECKTTTTASTATASATTSSTASTTATGGASFPTW